MAVDNSVNMHIIHSKNKNYSYNTDTVKSIERSKQVDTQQNNASKGGRQIGYFHMI